MAVRNPGDCFLARGSLLGWVHISPVYTEWSWGLLNGIPMSCRDNWCGLSLSQGPKSTPNSSCSLSFVAMGVGFLITEFSIGPTSFSSNQIYWHIQSINVIEECKRECFQFQFGFAALQIKVMWENFLIHFVLLTFQDQNIVVKIEKLIQKMINL